MSEYYLQNQMEKKKNKTSCHLCAHLCGLSLLLKLLKLLSCDEADWFVPCDQLRSSRHRCQDDVSAQTADTGQAEREGKEKTLTYICMVMEYN